MQKKTLIYGIVVGILIAILGFYVYWFYTVSKITLKNDARLNEVVGFLNSQIQKSAETQK